MELFAEFNESLWANLGLFAACVVAIGVFGSRLAVIADQLADKSHIGEALMGGVLMGAVTSLSGSVLSVTAALNDMPILALSNAFGGMAAQMAFLGVADIVYRRSNLEHAAASSENIMQGALLVCVLSILLMAKYAPDWTIWNVHFASPLMIAAYCYGMWLINRSKSNPMWKPTRTKETRTDEPEAANTKLGLKGLWIAFSTFGLILGLSGWAMQHAASNIVAQTGINEAIMGALLTSVATSLPELVTSIAAVRRGALTLAVSGIIGGNAYDTLFAAFSDVAYRSGSIYQTLTPNLTFWIAINLLMSGVLILGLLVREKRGIANIGFESVIILAAYVAGAAVLLSDGGSLE